MGQAGIPGLNSLSPRERDVLRLLQTGMLTREVASSLGISISTLNKHLASTRRKLGVKRTAHALLLDAEGRRISTQQQRDVDVSPSPLCDFASALDACRTFDEAWDVLRIHADRLGVATTSCGLAAEPPGMVTNGVRSIRLRWPDQILEMFSTMGGVQADPTVAYGLRQTSSFMVDTERVLLAIRDKVPKHVLEFGEALLDTDIRLQIHQPGRDRLTQAPLMTTYNVPSHAINGFRRDAVRIRETLRVMATAFWDCVQSRRLMASSIAGLSRRQTEVLNFAARGFTVAEAAEHMRVSLSSAEKTLAAARKQLGAGTTAAAVYRAMVFRALI
jgi:DNA-binding CsgD family transcriptional regulator